jgi:cell division protein FtsQ
MSGTHASSLPLPALAGGGAARRALRLRLPLDVRLMDASAVAIAALLVLGVLGAAAWALLRTPALALRELKVEGDLQRTAPAAVQATAQQAVRGNFLGADLAAARQAFEDLPWVRHAVVRRVWPATLVVRIEEHQPVALWLRLEDGDAVTANNTPERLVNRQGEVFEANLGEVGAELLPLLTGPEGRSAEMLAMFRRLQTVFGDGGMVVQSLHLSGRSSWRVETDGGATVELGRGSDDEVVERTRRFTSTVGEAWRQHFGGAALESADLRHGNGYALRLAGVQTTAAVAPQKQR